VPARGVRASLNRHRIDLPCRGLIRPCGGRGHAHCRAAVVLLAWRNWQTRTAQDRMGQPVEVRVLSRATFVLSRWRLVNQHLQQKAGATGTVGHRFESTDLLAPTFPSCRPASFHQLGKPLSTSRSNSTFLHGRRCFCLTLYPCPTSSGGSSKFGTSGSRHRAAALFGSRRTCVRT
jgi:hypothetical protein